METIGVYKEVPLIIEPSQAAVFAAIGWMIVLGILAFALYRWYKKPARAVK